MSTLKDDLSSLNKNVNYLHNEDNTFVHTSTSDISTSDTTNTSKDEHLERSDHFQDYDSNMSNNETFLEDYSYENLLIIKEMIQLCSKLLALQFLIY